MDSKIKILIGALIVGILLIGGWWVWKNQHIPTQPSKSIIQSELKISVDGKLETITDIQLPVDKIEAEKIVKKFCEPKNPNYDYDYNAIKKVNDEWKIPIYNLNCPCYAVVNIESGETNCMKQIPFETKEVTITTDKTEYKKGEEIKLTVINDFDKPIYYRDWSKSWNECVGSFRLGKKIKEDKFDFFEIGLAECLKPIVSLKPHSKITYSLDPKELEEIPSRRLEKGTYKLEFTFGFEEDLKTVQKVYSNEFTIK